MCKITKRVQPLTQSKTWLLVTGHKQRCGAKYVAQNQFLHSETSQAIQLGGAGCRNLHWFVERAIFVKTASHHSPMAMQGGRLHFMIDSAGKHSLFHFRRFCYCEATTVPTSSVRLSVCPTVSLSARAAAPRWRGRSTEGKEKKKVGIQSRER